jgi:hypothetical protein
LRAKIRRAAVKPGTACMWKLIKTAPLEFKNKNTRPIRWAGEMF